MTLRDSLQAACNTSTRDVWGESCTVNGQAATGIFDRVWLEVAGGEVGQSAQFPVLSVVLADLPIAPAAGQAVTVAGGAYAIQDVQVDGYGGAKLILQRTA